MVSTLSVVVFANITHIQTLYDQKNYAQAIEAAKESFASYGNARLHILWGQSAESLGNYEEAMSAYERVLMITPDNAVVRVKLANLYTKTGRNYLIKQLLEGTEDYQLTSNEKDTIEALMQGDESSLSASASISAGYDSNINVSPADLEIPNTEEVISTKFMRLQAGLTYTYKLEDIENTYLQSGLALSSQHNEERYFDLLLGVANAGVGYRSDNFDLYVPLKYSRLYFLNRDMMESIGINPEFNYILSSSLIGNLNAKYTNRRYIQEADQVMDDSILGIGTGLYWLQGDNLAYLKASYNDYRAKFEEESLFIGKESIEVSTGLTYYLKDDIFLDLSYRYRDTSYDDNVASTQQKRSDEYQQADVKLGHLFADDFEGSLSYSYASNSSNSLPSEYSKNIVMCTLKYRY